MRPPTVRSIADGRVSHGTLRRRRVLWRAAARGACAVGPDFKTPAGHRRREAGAPTATRASTTQTAADSLWWKSFNDPALDRLVELAYRQNLPLQIAGLRIVEARAQLGIATGQQFPQTQVAVRQRDARSGSARTSPTSPASTAHFGDYQVGLRRGLGAGLLGQVPARRGGGGGQPARVGGRLRRGARLADRGGRAHLRRDPHLRGADRAGARRTHASRRRRCGIAAVALPERRDLGARSDPGDDAAREHARLDPAARRSSSQQARNALSTLLGQPPGTVDALLAGPKEIPTAPAQGGRRRAGRDAAAAPGHPQRRAARRRAVRPHRRRQGRSLSELLARSARSACAPAPAATASHNLFSTSSLFYSVGPQHQLAVPQLRPARRTPCASRTRASSSCSSTTATPCSRRRRRSRTR